MSETLDPACRFKQWWRYGVTPSVEALFKLLEESQDVFKLLEESQDDSHSQDDCYSERGSLGHNVH
jgi:hypothetical protein